MRLPSINRIQADTTTRSVFLSNDDSELFVYFPGGKDGPTSDGLLFNFLKINLVYPEAAGKAGVEGTVYVSFTIDINGKISNIEITQGGNPYFDAEAIRVISVMPNWVWDKKIAIKNRKLTRRTIPLTFRLK